MEHPVVMVNVILRLLESVHFVADMVVVVVVALLVVTVHIIFSCGQ